MSVLFYNQVRAFEKGNLQNHFESMAVEASSDYGLRLRKASSE
jgi:hypothetical protein